jgi:hypothetical protein
MKFMKDFRGLARHFRSGRAVVICEHVLGVFGTRDRCRFLGSDGEWYYCRARGFRWHASSVRGVVRREGRRVEYDRNMLGVQRGQRVNFCLFRGWGLIVIVIGFVLHALHWLLHPHDAG